MIPLLLLHFEMVKLPVLPAIAYTALLLVRWKKRLPEKQEHDVEKLHYWTLLLLLAGFCNPLPSSEA
ncbi:hypothetical protein D3C76_1796980 [compost metagenome]